MLILLMTFLFNTNAAVVISPLQKGDKWTYTDSFGSKFNETVLDKITVDNGVHDVANFSVVETKRRFFMDINWSYTIINSSVANVSHVEMQFGVSVDPSVGKILLSDIGGVPIGWLGNLAFFASLNVTFDNGTFAFRQFKTGYLPGTPWDGTIPDYGLENGTYVASCLNLYCTPLSDTFVKRKTGDHEVIYRTGNITAWTQIYEVYNLFPLNESDYAFDRVRLDNIAFFEGAAISQFIDKKDKINEVSWYLDGIGESIPRSTLSLSQSSLKYILKYDNSSKIPVQVIDNGATVASSKLSLNSAPYVLTLVKAEENPSSPVPSGTESESLWPVLGLVALVPITMRKSHQKEIENNN